MSARNSIALCSFFGVAMGLIAVADSDAQPGNMMQKKEMMMKMMGKGGMMHCCGMMGGAQKKEADDCHKLTMECCKKDKVQLCEMLKSDKAEERFSAALAIGEKGLPLTGELIGLLTDKSDPVRQAARRSLMLTSYHLDAMKKANKKGAVATYVDFGPIQNANPTLQKQSVKGWTEWATKNEKDLKKLEQMLEPASATVQATHTKDSLDKVKASLKNKKAIILDVREQSEWDDGHLKDAQLLPLSRLNAGIPASDLAKLLPTDKTIYAHCGSGRRVLDAAEILQKAGYRIESLKTGYADLVKAGLEKAVK
jgi:rhodanese-related sulfurtransferase